MITGFLLALLFCSSLATSVRQDGGTAEIYQKLDDYLARVQSGIELDDLTSQASDIATEIGQYLENNGGAASTDDVNNLIANFSSVVKGSEIVAGIITGGVHFEMTKIENFLNYMAAIEKLAKENESKNEPINTPLTAIKTLAECVAGTELNAEDVKKVLEVNYESVRAFREVYENAKKRRGSKQHAQKRSLGLAFTITV